MRNNLKILSLGLILGAMGLASCDTINFALKESIQNEKIINVSEDIPHNDIQDLFEKVVPNNSTSASKVLDSLLLRLAKSYYGEFYDAEGVKGLRSVIAGGDSEIKAFVDKYARFQVTKDDGTRDSEAEVEGVKDFYEHIFEAVKESLWSNVSNTTYQVRSFFSEKKFYDTQKAALYNLDAEYGESLEDDDHLTQIDGVLDKDSIGEYLGSDAKNYLDVYQDYVERSILPDIYRKVLVEKYLIENNYTALGRSQARKVQTISLKNISEAADATRNLVFKYAEFVLEGTVATIQSELAVSLTEEELDAARDLKFLSRLYDGLIDVDSGSTEGQLAAALYEKADWPHSTIDRDGDNVDDLTYYPLTTLGKIYDDYKKLSDVRWETSSTTDFTGSGAYTKETGLALKERDAFSKNSARQGWYVSSVGSIGDMPSDLRTRLFSIKTANEVDGNYDKDTFDVLENQVYDNGMYVQGSYYLTPETYGNTEHPYLIYDSSSTAWTLVRVDEAVKGPKLSTNADSTASYSYLEEHGLRAEKDTQNQIVWRIAGMIASGDSYVKAARQKVLEAANLKYHDQDVYDYFESNFPDLFD